MTARALLPHELPAFGRATARSRPISLSDGSTEPWILDAKLRLERGPGRVPRKLVPMLSTERPLFAPSTARVEPRRYVQDHGLEGDVAAPWWQMRPDVSLVRTQVPPRPLPTASARSVALAPVTRSYQHALAEQRFSAAFAEEMATVRARLQSLHRKRTKLDSAARLGGAR